MADVADKLQLRPDQRVHVLEAPTEASALLAGITRAADQDGADAVLLFARDQAAVRTHAAHVRDHLRAGGIVWAAFPSAASGVATDLEAERGWDALAALGLRPVRQVALDAVWSALRFRFADDERGG